MLESCKAGIAQLVERNLAKVEVAGSNPVSRSNKFFDFNNLHSRNGGFDRLGARRAQPFVARGKQNSVKSGGLLSD